ncbi:MAG: SDR family oxidoreductase [Candidatus Hydrogenedentes bacterium]|nr:SDR family oxidoreductase [Candidatus Hydrogenedentota bacterium]
MEQTRPMSIALTGPSGHVGCNLIRALLGAGHRLRALLYPGTAIPQGLDVEPVRGDVLDEDCLRAAFDGAEVVYHLAAVITLRARDDERARRVNVEGTRNVVKACRECGVRRLVHFSSIHALSAHPAGTVIDETRPLCEGTRALAYDRSKADAERVVLAAVEQDGLDAVIVNPTGVMGPHDYEPSRMGRALIDLCRGKMPASVGGGFNWVDVRDVCLGAIAAEQRGAPGERFILGGEYLTMSEIAQILYELTGAKPPSWCVPLWLAQLALPFAALHGFLTHKEPLFTRASLYALCNHQQVSHEKAARVLDYQPRPIRQTLEDTVAWFRSVGYL